MWYLVQCNIEYDSEDNIWFLNPDVSSKERGCRGFKIKASPNMMKKLLFKLKAKDDITSPRSSKGRTYQQIVDEIMNNTDNVVYFKSTTYPKNKDELNKIFVTIKEMKEQKDNINYNKYAKDYNMSVDDVKNKYWQAMKLATEIYGNDEELIKRKYNKWLMDTFVDLLKENKKIMSDNNMFIKFVESNSKSVDDFITNQINIKEEVTSGDVTSELDDTSGKQKPKVKKIDKKEESVEDKETNDDFEDEMEGEYTEIDVYDESTIVEEGKKKVKEEMDGEEVEVEVEEECKKKK